MGFAMSLYGFGSLKFYLATEFAVCRFQTGKLFIIIACCKVTRGKTSNELVFFKSTSCAFWIWFCSTFVEKKDVIYPL